VAWAVFTPLQNKFSRTIFSFLKPLNSVWWFILLIVWNILIYHPTSFWNLLIFFQVKTCCIWRIFSCMCFLVLDCELFFNKPLTRDTLKHDWLTIHRSTLSTGRPY
jgi:hypothetical protein